MRNFAKKLISGLTTLSMCASMFVGISVSADGPAPVTPTINRKLSVEFMGRGSEPRDSSPGKARLTADDIGNEFWVGVAVDKVNDLELFTGGIYSLEAAFEYNPNFLEPYTTSTDPDNEWQNELEKGNLKAGTNDSAWWNSSQYEIISVRSTDIDTVNDREDLDKSAARASDGWKMCTVCVTFNVMETFANARFDGLTDDGKQYLLKVPFKLKAVPAESDPNPNPTVLSLVRGSETLDIASKTDGTYPHSTWEATVTDWTDQTNMKTLFVDTGDISLFDSGGSISDIIPVKPMTGEETSDTNYTLSTSKLLQEEGFDGETYVYYLSVPNETEKIRLDITSSDLPTVNANGTAITATLDSGQLYKTDEFNLLELNKDTDNGGEADGFNNTVTVEAGSATYTIHIRRLLKPKIVLNYGNSPYGEIMKDDSITDKDAAKNSFMNSDPESKGNYHYDSSNLPIGCSQNIKYTSIAWRDYEENYDLNDYAIFVYGASSFLEPGIQVLNELGNDTLEQYTVTMDVNTCFAGIPKYDPAASVIKKTLSGTYDLTSNKCRFNLSGIIIRPDVYMMNYVCTYKDASGSEKNIEIDRPVVIIYQRGDIALLVQPAFNPVDAQTLLANLVNLSGGSEPSLFAYRMCDLNTNTATPVINFLDYNEIRSKSTSAIFPFEEYYIRLPK